MIISSITVWDNQQKALWPMVAKIAVNGVVFSGPYHDPISNIIYMLIVPRTS